MTPERTKELLHNLVEHTKNPYPFASTSPDAAALELLTAGFTEDELVNEFGFRPEDVRLAQYDMDEEREEDDF